MNPRRPYVPTYDGAPFIGPRVPSMICTVCGWCDAPAWGYVSTSHADPKHGDRDWWDGDAACAEHWGTPADGELTL